MQSSKKGIDNWTCLLIFAKQQKMNKVQTVVYLVHMLKTTVYKWARNGGLHVYLSCGGITIEEP